MGSREGLRWVRHIQGNNDCQPRACQSTAVGEYRPASDPNFTIVIFSIARCLAIEYKTFA